MNCSGQQNRCNLAVDNKRWNLMAGRIYRPAFNYSVHQLWQGGSDHRNHKESGRGEAGHVLGLFQNSEALAF